LDVDACTTSQTESVFCGRLPDAVIEILGGLWPYRKDVVYESTLSQRKSGQWPQRNSLKDYNDVCEEVYIHVYSVQVIG
jgi:hypothetical protein